MRRNAISSAVQEEEAEINMTPMLDVGIEDCLTLGIMGALG